MATGALLTSCTGNLRNWHKTECVSLDLDSIRARGRLVAITDFNSANYFVYKGEPMGFTFDILKAFTAHLGIGLDIITETHLQEAVKMLNDGEADIIASSITFAPGEVDQYHRTAPVGETRQVLIQRKPRNWKKMNASAIESMLVRNREGLTGRSVYIEEGSEIQLVPGSASGSAAGNITVVKVPYESDILTDLVETGEIDFAICDENMAKVSSASYPDLDVSTPVTEEQSYSWAIRKEHSAQFQKEFDQWLTTFRKTDMYAVLYDKYFRNSRSADIMKSDSYSLNSGRVSQWDDIIKLYSVSISWDWRLLASLICQESRFIPDVQSRRGAYGLMQVMPETGKHFGIDITASPRNNIKAGTEYIKWLHSIFDPKVPDKDELTHFILAAYNAGPGHVLDAMKLAEKNGNDPTKWENNVEVWLQKKSDPKYFNDSVVKNGFFKGKESVAFVNQVLGRYQHYKNIIP